MREEEKKLSTGELIGRRVVFNYAGQIVMCSVVGGVGGHVTSSHAPSHFLVLSYNSDRDRLQRKGSVLWKIDRCVKKRRNYLVFNYAGQIVMCSVVGGVGGHVTSSHAPSHFS
jgi:uncharacterized membrane protein SpoIIM required for sporulation